MKIYIIGLFLFLLLFWEQSVAQDNHFKVSVISPVVSTITTAYERKIFDEKSSVQANVSITYGHKVDAKRVTGWAFGADYRRYLWTIAKQNGIYFSPFMRYQRFKISVIQTDASRTAKLFTTGAMLGRQWIFSNRFVFDAFGGPSLNAASSPNSSDIKRLGGIRFRAGFLAGIRF